MSDFKQKIMAAAAQRECYAEEHYVYDTPEECFKQHGDDCAIVDLIERPDYDALITRLVDEVEVLKAALERMKTLTITDGCEECSAVWQREYVPSAVRDALAAHQKRWEDLK